MLRFVLAILILLAMIKITQKDPVLSFGIGYGFIVLFIIYTISFSVENEDTEIQHQLMQTQEGEKKYYDMINRQ